MRLELLGADHPNRRSLGNVSELISSVSKLPVISNVTTPIVSLFGGDKPTSKVLFRNRDDIFKMFNAVGIDQDIQGSPLNLAALKNRMTHDGVPAKKNKGDSYNPEFQRLHQMVIDTFVNMGRSDLAKYFFQNVPVYTTTVHPIQIIQDLLNSGTSTNQSDQSNSSSTVTDTSGKSNVTADGSNNNPKKTDNTVLYVGLGIGGLLLAGGITAAVVSGNRKKSSSGLGRIRKPKARKSVKRKKIKARKK